MKNKFSVFGMLAMALILGLALTGCDTTTGGNGPTSPTAAYMNEKNWELDMGGMGGDITSIDLSFSGTNQWTVTIHGGSYITSSDLDGKTVIGTYTVSGLTFTFTTVGGTLFEVFPRSSIDSSMTGTVDATQATKFTTSQQNTIYIFNRQP
jgi:hypothetical protein